MQCKLGFEAGERFKRIAIHDGGVVITSLHDHKQVQRIGFINRLFNGLVVLVEHAGRVDFLFTPHRHCAQWGLYQIHQISDLLIVELIPEGWHLGVNTTILDGRCRSTYAQTLQTFRDERRANAA